MLSLFVSYHASSLDPLRCLSYGYCRFTVRELSALTPWTRTNLDTSIARIEARRDRKQGNSQKKAVFYEFVTVRSSV